MITIGSKVRVKASLKKGMGVCEEQLMYKGECFKVSGRLGYAVTLQDNDFVWSMSDLEVV